MSIKSTCHEVVSESSNFNKNHAKTLHGLISRWLVIPNRGAAAHKGARGAAN